MIGGCRFGADRLEQETGSQLRSMEDGNQCQQGDVVKTEGR